MSTYSTVKKAIKKRREWLDTYKNKPCNRCGNKFPSYVMDFHHVNPDTKRFNLSAGIFRHSRESILEELKKCILLCANCHRIIEYKLRERSLVATDVS